MNGDRERERDGLGRLFLGLTGSWRIPCLGFIALITLLLLSFALEVRIESDNRSMVSNDPQLQVNYDRFRSTFGADETLLLAVTKPDLLHPRGLRLVERLTEDLAATAGVARVLSLTTARQLKPGELGAEAVPLVAKPYREQDLPRLADDLAQNPELAQMLLSRDRRTALFVIDLENDPVQQVNGIAGVEKLVARYRDQELHLTGIPLLKLAVSRLVQRDQQVIVPLSVLVLALLLLLMFRRLSGIFLPLAVMGVTLCWTIGIYSLCGYSLNPITGLLPPVIMVISIATTVHLYSGWLQLAGEPGERHLLLAREMRRLSTPCFFTALTTALGLLSLLVSDVPAVRLFGLFAAMGVMLSFLVNILVAPAVLSFLRIPETGRRLYDAGTLNRLLHATAQLTVNSPRLVLALSLFLALSALGGAARIRNNTDLLRFLKSDSPLHRDTLMIDRAVGGVNRVEFLLARKDGRGFTNLEDLSRLARLHRFIDGEPGVSGSYSIFHLLRQLHRAEMRGKELTLPENSRDLLALFDLLEAAPDQEFLRKLISADFTRLRLSVRTSAMGTSETASLVERIGQTAARELGGDYTLIPTGEYYQVVSDSNRLVDSVVSSFSLSLATVFGAFFIQFRSLKLLLLSLIPNLIPLAWTVGLMALLDIDLSSGTAMIAAVAIGLTVDSTIHYLARFRMEERGECREAVLRTTMATGRALVISALVLFFGFSVGGLSSFLPTIYFSVLTGVTMVGAVICDLLVLPASLVLCDAWQRR